MLKPVLAALAVASFVTLGACTQETRIEEESDAEQALENAGAEIEQAGENAASEIEQAGDNAADSVNDATDGNPNTNP
jgi:outer membrane murein-binding lipoprotein Lpp